MLFRSLVATSALALSASAFMVIPEVHHPHDQDHRNLPASNAIELEDSRSQTIQLTCDECPFPETDSEGVVSWNEATKSSLEFNFYSQDGSLYVNNARIFPVNVLDTAETVSAVQRRESDGQETEELKLGFALMALPLAPPRDNMELIQIRFSPLDIDGHPAPLDTISITAIRTTEGELFILQSEVEQPAGEDDHASWRECKGEMQCLRQLIFDRIRALIQSAQAHMMNFKSKLGFGMGCHGKPHAAHRRPGHRRPEFGEFEEGHGFPHGDGEHPHPPHPPHPHHHSHGLRRTLFRIVRFILIPAVLGVFAGLTASAIGMLVGQAIVFLWSRYRRGTAGRSTSTSEQGSDSEKAVLMEEDASNEELPLYTDEDNVQAAHADAK